MPESHHNGACVSVTRGPNPNHELQRIKSNYSSWIYHFVSQTHISPLIEAHSQANVILGNPPRLPGLGPEAVGLLPSPACLLWACPSHPRAGTRPRCPLPCELHRRGLPGGRHRYVNPPYARAMSQSPRPHPDSGHLPLPCPNSSTCQSDNEDLHGFALA